MLWKIADLEKKYFQSVTAFSFFSSFSSLILSTWSASSKLVALKKWIRSKKRCRYQSEKLEIYSPSSRKNQNGWSYILSFNYFQLQYGNSLSNHFLKVGHFTPPFIKVNGFISYEKLVCLLFVTEATDNCQDGLRSWS